VGQITSFLVKIASRCNLDCDYCYVYHHADQSWRSLPPLMSAATRTAFANRLADYTREADIKRCVVVLHGGEPLLADADAIAAFVQELRATVGSQVDIDVGMQTNGVLLTDSVLDKLEAARVSVSLSLDGPRAANDLHRNSRRGRSSFDKVMAGLERLKKRPAVFAGIIAVIDPRTTPETLFAFFDEHQPPKLDFLLPDAHHHRPPPGRDTNPNLYRDWLIGAFDLWLDHYPHVPVRTFEALLDAAAGLPTGTDAFGLGDVSLLSIETDGAYHDLDVFKIVADGATQLAGSVVDTPIRMVADSEPIATHRRLLTREGLSAKCQACSVVDICGGGSLPHRFGPNGFNQPSIYCDELFALITHVRRRLSQDLTASAAAPISHLPTDFDFAGFELAETASPSMAMLCDDAQQDHARRLREALERMQAEAGPSDAATRELQALSEPRLKRLASEPGVVAWTGAYVAKAAGRMVLDVDGVPLSTDTAYLDYACQKVRDQRSQFEIGLDDPWLRLPFGKAIVFETQEVAREADKLVREAFDIIVAWRPVLAAEMGLACRAVQFVRDPAAHPEKIVSFSDNSVPGALFVSVMQGERLIDPYDLADSLIHEHRHQKLYLLERFGSMVSSTTTLVSSPWREDPRPPSGLLHAIFVFIELRRFWIHVRDNGPTRIHQRAVSQLSDTDRHLAEAFETLKTCPLTDAGRALAEVLDAARQQSLAMA
jgi:uncharacterized protein